MHFNRAIQSEMGTCEEHIPPSTVGQILTSRQPLFNLLMAYRLATVQRQSVEFSFILKRTCMCSKTQPEVKLYDYDEYSKVIYACVYLHSGCQTVFLEAK